MFLCSYANSGNFLTICIEWWSSSNVENSHTSSHQHLSLIISNDRDRKRRRERATQWRDEKFAEFFSKNGEIPIIMRRDKKFRNERISIFSTIIDVRKHETFSCFHCSVVDLLLHTIIFELEKFSERENLEKRKFPIFIFISSIVSQLSADFHSNRNKKPRTRSANHILKV